MRVRKPFTILLILLPLISPLFVAPDFVAAQSSEQVNTTAPQTLTNKTLTAPVITSPSITGTVGGGASYTAPTLVSPTISTTINGSPTFPSPGAIGAGTPSTVRGTTLTATICVVVGTAEHCFGTGSPEGVLAKPVSSIYHRTDGGTGTSLYIKETGGATNAGWVAFATTGTTWSTPGTIGSGTPNTGAFTTLSVTGQFTSTLSTGTTPLVIASTTKVSNLNVDLLDGVDWAAPAALGTTTPAAMTGTTITANTEFIGGTTKIQWGSGSPEGVKTAPVGSIYFRTDGSSGTTLYTKEAGSGNAGWAAMAPSTINWAVPGAIGATTPNTAVFTSMTAARFNTKSWSPTYGATVTIDVSQGTVATITVSNTTAFVISNPTNSLADDELWIRVKNTSGGIIQWTWDTQYVMATPTKPATGKFRVWHFKRLGTSWIEFDCSPEIANEP